MNITKDNKNKPELIHQSKSFLLISTDYQLETLYLILIKNPSLVNKKDQKRETFLSYAIKRKNIDICELILTSPLLDISYQNIKGNSYLHLAVMNQLENIIHLLIKKGININLQNNEGNTALHYAYNTGDIKFIAILVENKADLNIKNKNGIIPEEIEIDSLSDNLDINYSNNSSSNTSINNKQSNLNTINTNNSNTINMNDKNNIGNISNYKNKLLPTDKSKINKTIKIDWDNNDINYITNSKNNLKYSLVNYSYSEDEDNDNNNNKDDSNEKNKNKNEKFSFMNKSEERNNNLNSSDIFELTSTMTYKEKLSNLKSINSHIVGDLKNLENNEDKVNLKTSEKKLINYNLNNDLKNKNIIKTATFKTDYYDKKNKINISEDTFFNRFKTDNKEVYLRNNNNEQNTVFNFSNLITNAQKHIDNNGQNNNNINNENNTIFYQPEFNENFSFSPFVTIKESLNKKKALNNNQQLYYNSIKNVKIVNNSNNKNDLDNNLYLNSINESLPHPNPSFLNSKSNGDLNSSEMTAEDTVNKSKNIINNSTNTLYTFLSEIKLDKYYNIMNSNGFEDIQVLINQGKSMIAITDSQLKEAGINIPGDRAKILIRLQEKSGNFVYQIPKNVYYTCNDMDNYMNDFHIKKLYEWLQAIKIENYLDNFIEGGYHSVELMLIQMESKNPITDSILKDDLGINKIGHRARIINKLLEEGKKYHNKLKTSMLVVGNGQTEKICDCIIF